MKSVGWAPPRRGCRISLGKDAMSKSALHSSRPVAVVVLALGGAAIGCDTGSVAPADGTGGDGGVGGSSGGMATAGTGAILVCDPRPPVIDPTAVIDDMEDRNGSLTYVSGRNGGWWTAGDETPGGSIEPFQPIPEAILGGRCGSEYAMRVTGQGFDDWGSVLGLSFAYSSSGTVAYDASFRQGIRFWARVGDTSTRTIQFNLGDFHSSPDGGYCAEEGEPSCFNYGVVLSQIDTSWKQYVVPFGALVHATDDNPNEPLDPSTLYTASFYFQPQSVFDLWVDDLEFY